MSAGAVPYRPDCGECDRLKAGEERARAAFDPCGEVDCRVLARRHLRTVHGVVAEVGE